MKKPASLNRRTFLHLMGTTAAAGAAAPWLHAATLHRPGFAYVSGGDTGNEKISVFSIRDNGWSLIQSVASNSVGFLLLHPTLPRLYAIKEVASHEGLPTGAVETYSIEAHNGRLALLDCAPLSLAATLPSHMALSPDGRFLVVSSHGGGMYNVLPIAEDGRLGRVVNVLKETGSGPISAHQDASHPQHVVFDPSGRFLISSDLGMDSLQVFAVENGPLRKISRTASKPGSGPRRIILHPSGNLAFVAHSLDGSLSSHRFHAGTGCISDEIHRIQLPYARRAIELTLHPSGRYLYAAAEKLTAWHIDPAGRLTQVNLPHIAADVVTLSPDGTTVYTLSRAENGISGMAVGLQAEKLSQPAWIAKIDAPRHIALRSL